MVQNVREVPPNSEITGAAPAVAAAASHGIEVAVEFKPVEHPTEPLDNDRPVQCPLPEPSILNVSQHLAFLTILTVYISKLVGGIIELKAKWERFSFLFCVFTMVFGR